MRKNILYFFLHAFLFCVLFLPLVLLPSSMFEDGGGKLWIFLWIPAACFGTGGLAALEEKAAVSVRLFSFAALVLIGIPVLAVSDLASPAAVLLYAAVYASGFGISYLILHLTYLLSREEKRKKK